MLRSMIGRAPGAVRYLLFSGKGGVGKTTIAASTAVWLADAGFKTLVVSTDVQASLNDIFQQEISADETPIRGVSNLSAFTVDPPTSMRRHRTKMMNTLKVIDPESTILRQMEIDSEMDCGSAQASVFEFSQYLNDRRYDRIVFDTAPTGMHLEKILGQVKYTLAMAAQIEARKEMMNGAAVDLEKLKREVADLEKLKDFDAKAIETLRSNETAFFMALTPEGMPLGEVERNVPILEQIYGIPVRGIVINRVLPPSEREGRSFWTQRWNMQRKYIGAVHEKFPEKAIEEVHLVPEVSGLELLRRIGAQLYGQHAVA